LAIFIPWSSALHSASLLEAWGKLILSIYFNLSPCGDIRTTPAPAPWILFDPSKYIVHTLDKSGGPVFYNSSHSAVKSGKTWDLIAFHFSYVMSRGDACCCLMRKQTVLVRGDDQPVGNPKRKVWWV
jgi:hypothetical protein